MIKASESSQSSFWYCIQKAGL